MTDSRHGPAAEELAKILTRQNDGFKELTSIVKGLTQNPIPTDPVVYGALVKAQRAVKPLEKDAFNRFHGYKYASSEAVIDEGRKALNEGGLALLCIGWGLCDREEQERTQSGKNNNSTRVLVIKWIWGDYLLAHESGATTPPMRYEVAAVLEAGRPDDKAIAGALTLQLAYVLRQILLIPRQDKTTTDANSRNDSGSSPSHKERVSSGLAALKDFGLDEKRLLAHLKIKDKSKIGRTDLVSMRKLFKGLESGKSVKEVLGRAKEGATASNADKVSPAAQGGKDAPEDSPPPHDDDSAPTDDWEAAAMRDLE